MKNNEKLIRGLLPLLMLFSFLAIICVHGYPMIHKPQESVNTDPVVWESPADPHGDIQPADAAETADDVDVIPEEDSMLAHENTVQTLVVRATAYNADPAQTDDTPEICAWGDRVRPGIIAVSRDLEKMGLTRGREVHVHGIGRLVVLDRMHQRKRNQIDIFMDSYEEAMEFGVQELTISWNDDLQRDNG